MKTVTIKRMSFVNFKGLRQFAIDFNPEATDILGANGSGKTTVFDGFTWVLFGKDSKDRKNFDIKTLDADGKAIPKLPHEVSVTLDCNGKEATLTRRYCEKWQKRRGEAEEAFTGHEEERLYNGVPCSLKEWNDKIASICPEQVFKFITNPAYFTAQKANVQRSMLFDMAGDIPDKDIAATDPEFADLLASLTGKTMEEYRREIQAKKSRLKDRIDTIPELIEERRRDTPEGTDFAAVERELAEKKKAIAEIDSQLADISETQRKANERKKDIYKKIDELGVSLSSRQWQIKDGATAEYRKAAAARDAAKYGTDALQSDIRRLAATAEATEKELAAHAEERADLIAEWKSIKAETLSFDADAFTCPTCGRPLDLADIDKKQAEMSENFNRRKAERLDTNVRRGKALKAVTDSKQQTLEKTRSALAKAQEELQRLQATATAVPEPISEEELAALYDSDKECAIITAQLKSCRKQLSDIDEKADAEPSELKDAKALLQGSTEELTKMLAQKELIERNAERIAELETELRTLSQELAELEKTEFTMARFAKAKTEAAEQRINSLFKTVRFKMYDRQINGGETETCEATVDGIPYSSLNNAAQINAGLDIINAICRNKGISAPIFIDNAESVLDIEPTLSQQIRLTVADTPELTTASPQTNLFNI